MKRALVIGLLVCIFVQVLPLGAQGVTLSLEVKSAILMDAATGTVLYEQNAHTPLAPASVTKVMTLLLIMEAIDSGKLDWNDTVTTSQTAAAKGGSQVYLKEGETMSVTDMVKAIAVSSANDCACAMAEHIAGSEAAFVELMNRRAGELGMADTRFVNCTGLDDDPSAQAHKTSAYDIALMSRELLVNHPKIKEFTTIWMDTIRDGTFGLSNTNKMVRFYPGATGLKTGFTSEAKYCLSASAMREDMELIAVVMGAETSAKRFAACKTMLDYGFANFALVRPQLPEDVQIPVTLGTEKSVTATPAQSPQILLDKSQVNMVTTELAVEPSVVAPVSKGQRLGTLTVKAGEQVLLQIPMVAHSAVGRLTWGDIFWKLLGYMAFSEI